MRPNTIITQDLPVMVVPVVVVLVLETTVGVMVVKEVQVHRVRATMVHVRVIIGIPLVVGVLVRKVTVETVPVVLIIDHTVVMV